MSHSFAEQGSLICKRCGRSFKTDIWLIVDVVERPDLFERIRAGTLHEIRCPHCDKGYEPRLVNEPSKVIAKKIRLTPIIFMKNGMCPHFPGR
jgi:uncharacterized Zn-finger protein